MKCMSMNVHNYGTVIVMLTWYLCGGNTIPHKAHCALYNGDSENCIWIKLSAQIGSNRYFREINRWNWNQNAKRFVQEYTFENVVHKVATIFFRPHCVRSGSFRMKMTTYNCNQVDVFCFPWSVRNDPMNRNSVDPASNIQLIYNPCRYNKWLGNPLSQRWVVENMYAVMWKMIQC